MTIKEEVLKEFPSWEMVSIMSVEYAIDLAIKIKTKECKEQKRKQVEELKEEFKEWSIKSGITPTNFVDELIDKIFKVKKMKVKK